MISVAGAGPAGCIAAKYSAKKDDTVIYESQRLGNRKVQCSGLVSKTGFERLGISISSNKANDFVLNKVRGARIYSPKGGLLEIDGGCDKAAVIDRRVFDNFLLDEAVDGGAKLINRRIDKRDVQEIRKKNDKLIIASGTDYNLHRFLGLGLPKRFLYGAQYEMKIECDKEFVEMRLDVPGFFSWIIPTGDKARIGLCTTRNPVPYLEKFIKKLGSEKRIKGHEIYCKNFGIIPVYDQHLKTQYKGISLVGDAAAHVKASTGGGIVLGGIAAKYSCEEDYEKLWKKEIGGELRLHLLIRGFLDRLSDKNTDRLIRLLAEKKDVIEKRGDMDYASSLISGYASDPVFLAKCLLAAPYFLLDII